MISQDIACQPLISEKALRRQIDRSVSRALVDGEYATLLLADPTVVLDGLDCPGQQYLSLMSIEASTLVDFARQAQALFWTFQPSTEVQLVEEDSLPMAGAAR